MSLISLLVTVLLLCLIFGAIWWLIGMIPLPAPFKTAAQIVVVIIAILLLLGMVFGGVNLPVLRLS